jgi:5-methyltetrahydropteroyltriglutamate--homocysteine methyltransferase
MFTETAELDLPATTTGSWPRPNWFRQNLRGRVLSEALLDVYFREEYLDAVTVSVSEQERAGLDIVTSGNYHLDADLGGLAWLRYPIERFGGIDHDMLAPASEQVPGPLGTLMSEVLMGWRLPTVVDHIQPRRPLELAKAWRVAQSRTTRPVKMGVASTQLVATSLNIATDLYSDDRRELMWDLATAMNLELRELAAAGCRVIQVEDPIIHMLQGKDVPSDQMDFLVDCFNHEISGLEDVEVWVHTCFGNLAMQRVQERGSYADVVETYVERVAGDVLTLEMKSRDFADLELFRPFRSSMRKKLAIGVVSNRTLQIESAEEVAGDIRYVLKHVDADKLILTSDAGLGRQGPGRMIAFYKAAATAQGANIVRAELGFDVRPVPAADPRHQIDVP